MPGQKTKQGHEMMFGVNHLGHFLFSLLLLPLLHKNSPSRIVVVASEAHKVYNFIFLYFFYVFLLIFISILFVFILLIYF